MKISGSGKASAEASVSASGSISAGGSISASLGGNIAHGLKIQKELFNLFALNYEFIQQMNENGQPAGKPRGGNITFLMAAPDNNHLFFHEWMASSTEHKDGTCTFSVMHAGKPSTKTMRFYHAYCIHLKEYIKEQDEQMLIEVTIYAKKITFGEEDDVIFGDKD
ncbi:MAG: hypothetical protein LBU83_06340 [Bacteroidales bacterium]|jgi:hypothetical protein|nr:hypothetical protein [Bacteroidales bacterium]